MQKKIILKYLSVANYVADIASEEMICYYKKKNFSFTNKKEVKNQVLTKIDTKIEKKVRKIIRLEFPSHNIIGEELKKFDKKSDFSWIIDPIDGTKAFITGIPVFTFLIALKYKNEIILGLVDQPVLKERYWNLNNKAYLNNKQIKVRKCQDLSKAIIAITDPNMFKKFETFNKKIFCAFNFIRWGTDALGYMRCAEGILDAVIERDIKIWDIAAIVPIMKASGGIITTWDGKEPGVNDTILACNNKKIHRFLVNTLQKYI